MERFVRDAIHLCLTGHSLLKDVHYGFVPIPNLLSAKKDASTLLDEKHSRRGFSGSLESL